MKDWQKPELTDLSVSFTEENPSALCETPNPGGVCHNKVGGQTCYYWSSKNSGSGTSGICTYDNTSGQCS